MSNNPSEPKYAVKLDKGRKIDLKDYDTDDKGGENKDISAVMLAKLGEELGGLQEWLYAAQTHSVLVVLQGLDTSGKDGTIAHVMASMNPQGCDVASFKVPTPEEAAHDFLWRIHKQTPAKGLMTIFNRSHYEDVLVTRVHKTVSKDTIKERYDQINSFEKLLVDSNTIVLKFFLHISKNEQKERLEDREKDEEKAWKLSAGDWAERQYWDDYTEAYEDALGATATKHAPWFIVPADHKWFRNLAVATALVETLRPYKPIWEEALKKIGEQRKAELAETRRTEGTSDSDSKRKTPKASTSKTHETS
jgi:PPK2 family polyphosphate:nucleotide phosphotransferase